MFERDFDNTSIRCLLIIRDALYQAYRSETIGSLKEYYNMVFEAVSDRILEITENKEEKQD